MDKHRIVSACNRLVNELEDENFAKSKETSKTMKNETQGYFKVQEDKRKFDLHIKRIDHFKTFVLVIITLVSFGLLIYQGLICFSKYVL